MVKILDVQGNPLKAKAESYLGASSNTPELATWLADQLSADGAMLDDKDTISARANDAARNDGYISGARNIHVDNIVGTQFKLSAKPNWKVLQRLYGKSFDDAWADEFSEFVEADFGLMAEDPDCWIDAERKSTFTMLCRMALLQYFDEGECCASAEWEASSGTPFSTCLKMIDPARLSNPNEGQNTKFLRKGVVLNKRGAPIAYHIRTSHPTDFYTGQVQNEWKRIARYKPWGRIQFIHLFGNERPDQNRDVSKMVGALQEIRTLKKLESVQLQNAVLNAMYAATIESDLDPATAFETIGVEGEDVYKMTAYLNEVVKYTNASGALKVNGLKIPHLPPGSKLNFHSLEGDSSMGSDFHRSLLSHIAAQLNLPLEQFSRDFSRTSYSSAKFGSLDSWKYFMSRRALVPARFGTHAYRLYLEERMDKGGVPLPQGAPSFWAAKSAYSQCKWIGSGKGQIDEVKETNAAILRIAFNLSTLETEVAKFGEDYREVLEQRAKEIKYTKQLKIPVLIPSSADETEAEDSSVDDRPGDNNDNRTNENDNDE